MAAVLSPGTPKQNNPSLVLPRQVADIRMLAIERRMRDLTRVRVVGQSQIALRNFLQDGASRDLAEVALIAADAFQLNLDDSIALAASAQLVHLTMTRHGEPALSSSPAPGAVLNEPVVGIGDSLLSAAYAAVASLSSASTVVELIARIHATISTCTAGRSHESALRDVFVDDYRDYEGVVEDSVAPLIALPFELVMTRAGAHQHLDKAQHLAKNLSLAIRLATDLESSKLNQDSEDGSTCLNAVNVLQNAGFPKPRRIASANAFAALRNSIHYASRFPHGAAESLQPFFDRVLRRITAAST